MASEVTLPALGESVTEGTVTRWLKQDGDEVAVDEPLLQAPADTGHPALPPAPAAAGAAPGWLKQVGDGAAVDEPLLEVSTDKVDTEIPAPVAGTLLEIKAQEDDTAEAGAGRAGGGGGREA